MNKQLISMIVVLCALFGFSQAQAQVACGDVITTPEVLTSNLTCTAPDPALTIVGPNGSLDMRGFTLSCGGSDIIGIELEGSGASLQNGTVRDCFVGVVAEGSGNHVVRQMSLRNNFDTHVIAASSGNRITNSTGRDGSLGFGVQTGGHINNTFTGNTATNNQSFGFFVGGGGNHTFRGNTATGNRVGFGMGVAGPEQGGVTTLSQNIARSNREDGFQVLSDNNTLSSNTASRNLDDGIDVFTGATNNELTGNAASGNGSFDLEDDNPNCDENIWRGNAGTRNQGCIR